MYYSNCNLFLCKKSNRIEKLNSHIIVIVIDFHARKATEFKNSRIIVDQRMNDKNHCRNCSFIHFLKFVHDFEVHCN